MQHFSNYVLCPRAHMPRRTCPPPLQSTACLAPGGRLLLRACMPGARRRLDSWHPMTTNVAIAPPCLPGPLSDSLVFGSVSVYRPFSTGALSFPARSAYLRAFHTASNNIDFSVCCNSLVNSAQSSSILYVNGYEAE